MGEAMKMSKCRRKTALTAMPLALHRVRPRMDLMARQMELYQRRIQILHSGTPTQLQECQMVEMPARLQIAGSMIELRRNLCSLGMGAQSGCLSQLSASEPCLMDDCLLA